MFYLGIAITNIAVEQNICPNRIDSDLSNTKDGRI